MNFRGALFDMDGTIFDTYEKSKKQLNTLAQKLWGRNLTPEELTKAFRSTADENLAFFNLLNDSAENVHIRESLLEKWDNSGILFDQIEEVLFTLHKKGVLLAIVTSRNTAEAMEGLKEHEQLLPLFKSIVCCDRVKNAKPHKEPALLAAKELGLSPTECLLIGDSLNDLGSAKHAKISFALAEWGAEKSSGLESSDYFVKTPLDLLPIFFDV